jgi:uracil-DNA glycosylase family 4
MSRDIADDLRFYQDLGITGISRDPAWRRRASSLPAGDLRPGPAADATSVPADELRFRNGGGTEVAGGDGGREAAPRLLTVLQEEIGPACNRCKLHTLGRKQVVFGVGNPNADLMFVGEAPGADEDEQGAPFVGRAGQLLTKIIEAIGLKREDVYIANVIKCRPPGNRNPEPDEVERCQPFLFRQIDAVKPKVIVALGKFAAQSLLQTTEPITRIRGRESAYRGATLIPTFHPAYLLRNPSSKREVWEDMKKVRAILDRTAGGSTALSSGAE